MGAFDVDFEEVPVMQCKYVHKKKKIFYTQNSVENKCNAVTNSTAQCKLRKEWRLTDMSGRTISEICGAHSLAASGETNRNKVNGKQIHVCITTEMCIAVLTLFASSNKTPLYTQKIDLL